MNYIINTFIYHFIEGIYIGAFGFAICYALYKPTNDHFMEITNNLTQKQDILHQSLVKLRNIIRLDDDLSREQNEHLRKIRDEIKSIKKILESNRLDYRSDSDAPVNESEESNSEEDECKSPTPLNLHHCDFGK